MQVPGSYRHRTAAAWRNVDAMKNLRTKMILIVFITAAIIFTVAFFLLFGAFVTYYNRQADGMTMVISSYGGEVPQLQEFNAEDFSQTAPGYDVSISEESAFSTRYFVVNLDGDLNEISADLEHVAAIDEDTAYELAKTVASGEKSVGYSDHYRFRVVQNDDGTISVIFLDCEENFSLRRMITIIMGVISIALIFLITLIFGFFSKRVMEPFEENSRRQKQFITDASHELKTPLAIISANAEVLGYKLGDNEWLNNITRQTAHMGELIDDLLTLSKMDEYSSETEDSPVNLTEIVQRCASSFSEVFKQKNAEVTSEIAPDVIINGNAKQLAMLVSILTENASKYVTEGGCVKISLSASVKYAVFQIFNTAELDENLNINKLFDRFYRPDSSRNSETGGHGIGLSTAQKIVRLQGGTLGASRKDGGICFTAELAVKKK